MKKFSIVTIMFAICITLTGCKSNSDLKDKIVNDKKNNKVLSSDSTNGKTLDNIVITDDETIHAEKANFYVGTNFKNYFNGGYITENNNYVFLELDDTIYRYDKSNGEMMKLCKGEDGCLNVSNDGFLYFIKSDKVHKTNIETGETEVVFSDGELPIKIASYGTECSMILADSKLFMAIKSYQKFMFFSIDIKTKSVSIYEQFEASGYGKDVYIDFAVMAAHGDDLYYEYTIPYEPMVLKKINMQNGMASAIDISDFNSKHRETVYDVSYGGDRDSYDIDLFDCPSDDFIACFSYNKPCMYNFATGEITTLKSNLIDKITENPEFCGIADKSFNDKILYVLVKETSNRKIYSLDISLGAPEVIYTCSDSYKYLEIADDHLWLIPDSDDEDIIKLSFEGSEERLKLSNAVDIKDPYDKICEGTLKGPYVYDDMPRIYDEPNIDTGVIKIADSGKKVTVLAKVVNGSDIFYKIKDENGDIGYVLEVCILLEREPDEFIDLSSKIDPSDSSPKSVTKNPTENNNNKESSQVNEAVVEMSTELAKKIGIVTTQEGDLNIRSASSTDSKIIGTAKRNSKIEIISEVDGWYEIEFDGKTGFVSAEFVKIDAN